MSNRERPSSPLAQQAPSERLSGGDTGGFAATVDLRGGSKRVAEDHLRTRCYLRPYATDHACRFRPDGQPDKAHLIPQMRLKQHGLGELCEDPRSYVFACRKHHHALDHGFLVLRLEDHPPRFLDFATEHGLFWTTRGWRVATP